MIASALSRNDGVNGHFGEWLFVYFASLRQKKGVLQNEVHLF